MQPITKNKWFSRSTETANKYILADIFRSNNKYSYRINDDYCQKILFSNLITFTFQYEL